MKSYRFKRCIASLLCIVILSICIPVDVLATDKFVDPDVFDSVMSNFGGSGNKSYLSDYEEFTSKKSGSKSYSDALGYDSSIMNDIAAAIGAGLLKSGLVNKTDADGKLSNSVKNVKNEETQSTYIIGGTKYNYELAMFMSDDDTYFEIIPYLPVNDGLHNNSVNLNLAQDIDANKIVNYFIESPVWNTKLPDLGNPQSADQYGTQPWRTFTEHLNINGAIPLNDSTIFDLTAASFTVLVESYYTQDKFDTLINCTALNSLELDGTTYINIYYRFFVKDKNKFADWSNTLGQPRRNTILDSLQGNNEEESTNEVESNEEEIIEALTESGTELDYYTYDKEYNGIIVYIDAGNGAVEPNANVPAILGARKALMNCCVYYSNVRDAMYDAYMAGDTDEVNSCLVFLEAYYDFISGFNGEDTMNFFNSSDAVLLPIIQKMWETPEYNYPSPKDLYAQNKDTLDKEGITLNGRHLRDGHIDNDTVLGMFYTINSDNNIVGYERDTILNDVYPGNALDDTVFKAVKNVHTLSMFNLTGNARDELNNLQSDLINTSADHIQSVMSKMQAQVSGSSTGSVDSNGIATGADAVTINKYITEGMINSASYIPMRTNMYSPETMANYDDEFLRDFYYKYGFLRKALLIDQSGSAAVDLYNANGQSSNNTRIATLRDIIEVQDNDIVLYIDPGFYNSAEAIAIGNRELERHLNVYETLAYDVNYAASILPEVMVDGKWTFGDVVNAFKGWFGLNKIDINEDGTVDIDAAEFKEDFIDEVWSQYRFDINYYLGLSKAEWAEINPDTNLKRGDFASWLALGHELDNANMLSVGSEYNEIILKDTPYTVYSNETLERVTTVPRYKYYQLTNLKDMTQDNWDSILVSSSYIQKNLLARYKVKTTEVSGDKLIDTEYTYNNGYSPAQSLSFVSLLYRMPNYFNLAQTVANNNPVFIASDDLVSITSTETNEKGYYENQWYRNSLLNWMLVKNLKANVQVDYTYAVDLDCPIYMDIFGNIITESGIVVIPAACNATLHTANFKNYNTAVGLYSCYGKIYSVPLSLYGAASTVSPFFVPDANTETYVPAPVTIKANGYEVRFDSISTYDNRVTNAIKTVYGNGIRDGLGKTSLNWMAMVNIINEVMRGAPSENIDKDVEGLYNQSATTSAMIAAIKYESLLEAVRGTALNNTLISVPDFTRLDNAEYWISLLFKVMMVLTVGVVIIMVYRDGVANQLGGRTFWKCITAIGLTFSVMVIVPAVFQLTYYTANKVLLEDEAFRILMINEEKRQTGVEIGMQGTTTKSGDGNFKLQLDWISVPWWKQLEYVLYGSTVRTVSDAKQEAYSKSPVYGNYDIVMENDGVYITTESLFDSVNIDYTWSPTSSGVYGLYLWDTNTEQTASFYCPYYVFLQSLTANVNEYNAGRSAESATNYNYTTKLMSGNRIKTVGLCYNYFNSEQFLYNSTDIMRLYQIYMDANAELPDISESAKLFNLDYKVNFAKQRYAQVESLTQSRALLFNDEDREAFAACLWYNNNAVPDLDERIEVMNNYARDFIASNNDLMLRVTDETFLKVMALYMTIKYNQIFGIQSANSLEINNLDTEDLLRLCIADETEAILSSSMSFPRFVYNYGGESSVYAAAILSMILWAGSFIKPLCSIIVFISVFLSIWVFRVLLQKPSSNLWGYMVTICLLCITNFTHSLMLKVCVLLPKTGLSMLGCLIVIIVVQVAYMLMLAYVTGVSLKDWANLGATEYEKEARRIRRKFEHKDEAANMLNGRVQHYENNWDHYNKLVENHRERNST